MIQTDISHSNSRSVVGIVLRVVLAAAAIGFVATRVDVSTIVATVRQADVTWILLAALLLPVNLGLEATTWYPVLRRVATRAGRGETFLAVVSGYPLGMFTPARVGELAGRALSIHEGDRTQIAVSAAVARLADLVVVFVAGTATLIVGLWTGSLHFNGAIALAGVSAAASVLTTSVVLAPGVIARLASRLHVLRRLEDKLAFLAELPLPVMARVLGYAALRLVVYSGQFVFLSFAFSSGGHPGLTWMAVLLTLHAKSIIPPITFLDLGIREGAAAFFFGHLGLSSATGFSAALMLFVINLVLPALFGTPLISRYRLRSATVANGSSPHVVEEDK